MRERAKRNAPVSGVNVVSLVRAASFYDNAVARPARITPGGFTDLPVLIAPVAQLVRIVKPHGRCPRAVFASRTGLVMVSRASAWLARNPQSLRLQGFRLNRRGTRVYLRLIGSDGLTRRRSLPFRDAEAVGQTQKVKAPLELADARLGATGDKLVKRTVLIACHERSGQVNRRAHLEVTERLAALKAKAKAVRDALHLLAQGPISHAQVVEKASDGICVGVAGVSLRARRAVALVEHLGRADEGRRGALEPARRRHAWIIGLDALAKVDKHGTRNLVGAVHDEAHVVRAHVTMRDRREVAGVSVRGHRAAEQRKREVAGSLEHVGARHVALAVRKRRAQPIEVNAAHALHGDGRQRSRPRAAPARGGAHTRIRARTSVDNLAPTQREGHGRMTGSARKLNKQAIFIPSPLLVGRPAAKDLDEALPADDIGPVNSGARTKGGVVNEPQLARIAHNEGVARRTGIRLARNEEPQAAPPP